MNHFLAIEGNEKAGILSKEDSHHALRVLRLKAGDPISVSYGEGKVYRAIVELEIKQGLSFKIKNLAREQKKPWLHLAVAPTKSNDRFELILEKATELGLTKIWPIICDHSERKVYKRERGKRIIEAAFKQSHKGYLPELAEALSFKDFIEQCSFPGPKYLAALDERFDFVSQNEIDFNQELLVMIGPEGDFSAREIEIAQNANFKLLSLGVEVLRTETAAIHLASLVNYHQASQ